MFKKQILILSILLLIPFISSDLGFSNPNLPKLEHIPEPVSFNNNTAFVNSSNIWVTNIGDLDDANSTQFDSGGDGATLNIIESWLTAFVNSAVTLWDADFNDSGDGRWMTTNGSNAEPIVDMNTSKVLVEDLTASGVIRVEGSGSSAMVISRVINDVGTTTDFISSTTLNWTGAAPSTSTRGLDFTLRDDRNVSDGFAGDNIDGSSFSVNRNVDFYSTEATSGLDASAYALTDLGVYKNSALLSSLNENGQAFQYNIAPNISYTGFIGFTHTVNGQEHKVRLNANTAGTTAGKYTGIFNGIYFNLLGASSSTDTELYILKNELDFAETNYFLYNEATADSWMGEDGSKTYWGSGKDDSRSNNGSDSLDQAEVGTPNKYFLGYDAVKVDGDFNQYNGNATINNIYAQMWNYTSNATAWTFPIAASGTYYNMTNLSMGETNGFTKTEASQMSGGSYLTAQVAGMYKIDSAISVESSANNQLFAFAISKNHISGNSQQCYARRWISTKSDIGSASISCLVDLAIGDTIVLQAENEASTGDLKIHAINVNVVRIGN